MQFDQTEYLDEVFEGLELASEQISGITFNNCRFIDCDFSDALLRSCTLTECRFERCNLSLARLDHSHLAEVSFDDCKAIGVDWTRVGWPNITLGAQLSFHDCVLNDASFYGLDLPELELVRCRLYDVDFREGDFSRARFNGSELNLSQFQNTRLSGADFTDASGYDINLMENQVQGAIFSRFEALNLLEGLGIKLVD